MNSERLPNSGNETDFEEIGERRVGKECRL